MSEQEKKNLKEKNLIVLGGFVSASQKEDTAKKFLIDVLIEL